MKKKTKIVKRKSKSFWSKNTKVFLIIGAVLVGILGIKLYLSPNSFSSNEPLATIPEITDTPEPTNYPSPLTDYGEVDEIIPISTMWDNGTEIYIDPKINITLQYPTAMVLEVLDTEKENMRLKKESPEVDFFYGITSAKFRTPYIKNYGKANFDYKSAGLNAARITLNVYENPKNLSVADYIRETYKDKSIDGRTPTYMAFEGKLTPTKVKDMDASLYEGMGGGENPKKIIFFPYKNKMYIFSLLGGNETGSGYSKDAEALLDKMLDSIELK